MIENAGRAVPDQAQVVVIGGGIVGCSVAYHLTKRGWRDVVLVERKQLTSGTTWHAAGLVTQLRATYNMSMLAKYSAELFPELERLTGLGTGFRRTGSILLATTEERWTEVKRQISMARVCGFEVQPISGKEAAAMWPLLDPSEVVGAAFLPGDGIANPTDVTQALAAAARLGGARIVEHTAVTGVTRRDGRVTGVSTERGDIAAEVVVNCTGMWARELGLRSEVTIPLHAAEHFYVVTEPVPGLATDLPVLRSPDDTAYFREDTGKLMVGFFEPGAKPWATHGIPDDAAFVTLPEDWDHLAPYLEMAARRVPLLRDLGIQLFFNGPESFTPDDRYILGEAPELDGYFVAAGFNSVGFQSGGGAGPRRRRLDRRRPSADGPLGSRHPAVHAVPGQPALPARPDDRDARAALRHALAVPPGRDRARRAADAVPRSRRRARRLLRRTRRLGAGELVCAGTASSRATSTAYGRQNWFPSLGRGAPGRT